MTLLLPWFPILLAVGIGGRLLGRRRGFVLGFLCALFWIALAQGSLQAPAWADPWSFAMLVAGAVAIFTIGGWAGETASLAASEAAPRDYGDHGSGASARADERVLLERLSAAMDQFDDWLEGHRDDVDPWPDFDELLRTVFYQCCRATHVRPYRLRSEGEELSPVSEPDLFDDVKRLPARKGIVGHVLTTGRPFIQGKAAQGELIDRLAADSPDSIVWCFAIKRGTTRLGAVVVGHLDLAPDQHTELLRAVERLVNQFWCTLHECCLSRAAVLDDPVSGLNTRAAFLRAAETSLRRSYDQGEPVAVGVIGVEGLRGLNDAGRWDVADELVREISAELRRKVRVDDCLGRFDGSRFVLLLRRVDSELASLIVSQLITRLARICGDERRWCARLEVRCGVVGSGMEKPDLRTLVSRAVSECHRARTEVVLVSSDLESEAALTAGGND
jgi:diguanylate cyclase (GGDEF)-like protein